MLGLYFSKKKNVGFIVIQGFVPNLYIKDLIFKGFFCRRRPSD